MSYGMKLRAQGERRVYMNDDSIFTNFLGALSSGTENLVAIKILTSTNLNGFLRLSQEDIAAAIGTSRGTVMKVFKKAKDHNVLLAVGKRWYLNPYVALPYNLGDVDCNKLQQMWDSMQHIVSSKGMISMKDALLIHEVLFGPDKVGVVYNEETGEIYE